MNDKESKILKDWVRKTSDHQVLNWIFTRALERKDMGLLYEAWAKSLEVGWKEKHKEI